MIEKIKKHFRKLNNTQKVFYFIITTFVVFGRTILLELGIFSYSIDVYGNGSYDTGGYIFGIIVVCFIGILLFKDNSEEK